MQPTAILYPAIAMFGLTFSLLAYLAVCRFRAVGQGEISIKYYRAYNEGTQPPRLHLLGRHIQNHFEVPPIFYIAVLFTFVAGAVNPVSVTLAWLFVAARVVHSFIHLGSNDVSRRFFTFGAGVLVLAGLWVNLLVCLLRSGA